ncbi:MAG: OPT/YSL family transporter, partial [Vicinamibacterales bacterium]
ATGIGIGMMVPAAVILVMFVGGVIEFGWRRLSPRTYEQFLPPVASGFIAGEALVAVVIPLLVVLGLLQM